MASTKKRTKPITAAETQARFIKAFELLVLIDAATGGQTTAAKLLTFPPSAWELMATVRGGRPPSEETKAMTVLLAASREGIVAMVREAEKG